MGNVYLVGMMGSGKSVTGRKLARMLDYGFTDLDDLIQERTKKTIAEIFGKEGEGYFRDQESRILKEVSVLGPYVVATGGGAVLRKENVLRMRETGSVFLLETSLPVLWERVRRNSDRPLLKEGDPFESLKRIFDERAPIYAKASDFRINTDGQTAEAVAENIFALLGKSK